jgi:hypothetical protein
MSKLGYMFSKKSAKIFNHDSLTSALKAIETYITMNFDTYVVMNMTYRATWRFKAASESQLALLLKFGLPSEGLNSGQAADLITRRIHGAKGSGMKVRRSHDKSKESARVSKVHSVL